MKIHELKIWPVYFEDVLSGAKTFELRKNDRDFQVGDILVLKEFNPGLSDETGPTKVVIEERGYTGREINKKITYIYKEFGKGLGLKKGFCILSIK